MLNLKVDAYENSLKIVRGNSTYHIHAFPTKDGGIAAIVECFEVGHTHHRYDFMKPYPTTTAALYDMFGFVVHALTQSKSVEDWYQMMDLSKDWSEQ